MRSDTGLTRSCEFCEQVFRSFGNYVVKYHNYRSSVPGVPGEIPDLQVAASGGLAACWYARCEHCSELTKLPR
ncbi:unnamed protein product [Pieris brassicae]|uniref:Uncharacterized protein n=1 Tax=Pieris brassicae TaxID=7116 RepID=A0A9P0TQC6_PIEBR|nr:unnamed protein product [Pieris brassicae]